MTLTDVEAVNTKSLKQNSMIDVVLLTRNACEKSGKEIFVKCLNSIYEALPVHHLIVVDSYSTDETLAVLDKYNEKHQNLLILQDIRGRGKARQLGISKVDTPWFVFVDSDVVFHPDWLNVVNRYIKDDIGAVEGRHKEFLDRPSAEIKESLSQIHDSMLALRQTIRKGRAGESFGKGFTGSVLIRTECVKNVTIPKFLHWYEDYYIQTRIIGKGFKWVVTDEEVADHHRGVIDVKFFVRHGAYARIFGFTTFRNLLSNFAKSFPKGFYSYMKSRNIRTFVLSVLREFYTLRGWAQWRDVVLKRPKQTRMSHEAEILARKLTHVFTRAWNVLWRLSLRFVLGKLLRDRLLASNQQIFDLVKLTGLTERASYYKVRFVDNLVQTKFPGGFVMLQPRDNFDINKEIFSREIYERLHKVQRGDTVIDAGAHVGVFTLKAARKAADGVVVAIEPHPTNYRLLVENVKHNKLKNVLTLKMALSNHDGVAKLYLSSLSGSHTITDERAHAMSYVSDEYLEVPVRGLDSIIEELQLDHVDMIKIDIEGGELDMLKGAEETLRHNKNIHLAIAAYHSSTEKEELCKFLLDRGMRVAVSQDNYVYCDRHEGNTRALGA